METLKLLFKNNSEGIYCADKSTEMDLYEQFSFFVPGYYFMEKYKRGIWDGKIRLINIKNHTFPIGLTNHIIRWGKENNVFVDIDEKLSNIFKTKDDDIMDFFKKFKFYSKKKEIFPRDDQLYAVKRAITNTRVINICPTSFGKSLSIFLQILWNIHNGRKSVIIVPTTDLVLQFKDDIEDYCTNEEGKIEHWMPIIQTLYSGQSKILNSETDVLITTWQSLYKMDKNFINQFDSIILDEAHKSAAVSIKKIFDDAETVKYRTGWTGSLNKDTIPALQAEALIGEIEIITDTATLMEQGVVADLKIIYTKLNYKNSIREKFHKLLYKDEITLLEKLPERNEKIIKIANSINCTGLILFSHIKHGECLYKLARKTFPEKNIYMIHGTSVLFNDKKYKNYEELKEQIENEKNAILICSYGKFSTGVSIKNINWLIFAIPTKSFVRVIQSVGRTLRVSSKKRKAVVIDIIDDMTFKGKKSEIKENHAFKHFRERFSIFSKQKFKYEMKNINMNIEV